MRRRTFILATVGGITGLAGCGGTADDSPFPSGGGTEPIDEPQPVEPPGSDDYETVVDLVAKGADDTGTEPIDDLLATHLDDDTLVHLRTGQYRVADRLRFDEYTDFAIHGPDATVIPSDGIDLVFDIRESTGFHLDGIDIDVTDQGINPRALSLRAVDELAVSDVAIYGTYQAGDAAVRIDVTEPDGAAVIDGLALPDGGAAGTSVAGIYIGSDNQGDIEFRDCHIEGFPDNGLYADPPAGHMRVIGGYYANSGISNVRVKGGSLLRDVTVVCDSDSRDFENMRGVRATAYESQRTSEPVVIDQCDIDLREARSSDGGIVLAKDLAKLIVHDTTIRVDTDETPAIWAKQPTSLVATGTLVPQVICADVAVTGSAGGEAAVKIESRDDCVFDHISLEQSGTDRDGIALQNAENTVIRDSTFTVSGEPIRYENATAYITDSFRHDGTGSDAGREKLRPPSALETANQPQLLDDGTPLPDELTTR